MPQSRLAIVVLSLLPALWTVPAASQTATFSGTVDGEARTWHVREIHGEALSGWAEFGPVTSVTIFGLPTADSDTDLIGALELSVSLMNQGRGLAPVNTEITFYADSMRAPYLVDYSEPDMTLTLTDLRIEGDRLHLSGQLAATVLRSVDLATETLDANDTHQITAEFALELDRQ